jgi:formyl-CoA transferase
MIRRFRLPDGQEVDLPGVVPKMSATPGETRWVGPGLGEHTAEVLGALGYGADEQAELRRKGVI